MPLAQLETPRLILRDITLEDAPSYQRHFADYEVIRHLGNNVPWPYSPNGAAEFIRGVVLPKQGQENWFWGIFLKENPGELIGSVALWRKGTPEHRGFWLSRAFWGQGLMTEAVVPVTDYAFRELGFEKLILSNALGNHKSRKIKEKTGARFIKTQPAKFVDPAYTESEIWELTKAEWQNRLYSA